MTNELTVGELKKQMVMRALVDRSIIKFGAFKLKLHEENPNAPLSPFYIDLRLVRSFPDLLDDVTDLYIALMDGEDFAVLADVPTAATPFTAVIAHKTQTPMISPRFDNKAYGTGSRIDGVFHSGQTVAVIDDLITGAQSKLQAIEALRRAGLVVHDVFVLIDREQGGVDQLRSAGVACHSVFRFSEMLRTYQEQQLISPEHFEAAQRYLAP